MKRRSLFFSFFALGCLCFCNYVFSETLILKSGQSVKGQIIEETDKYIKIDYQGIILTYSKDKIERVEKPEEAEATIQEQSNAKEIKIKIKGDTTQNDEKFINKLDSLGKDIRTILSDTQTKLTNIKEKDLTQEHRDIVQKAVSNTKDIIIEIKKLNPPANCGPLQKIFIEGGNLAIKAFEEDIPNIFTMEELTKYWTGYAQKLNKLIDKYDQEKQKILTKINPAS